MTDCNFYHPIEIRYGDLDPQGHVNNAKFITYFEHSRTHYLRHLSLYKKGRSFLDIGVILADLQITFHASIHWEDQIKAGVRTTKLGNKSLHLHQCIVDQHSDKVFATGRIVLVSYDYRLGQSILIPEEWRTILQNYEGL
jgi:acyl-CoA thioester hydrolase